MERITSDSVRLPAGTPMLAVGFTGTTPFDSDVLCRSMPDIVLAGKLVEPYTPGLALLLGSGPLSGSIASRGFRQVAFEAPTGTIVAMRHRHVDERGAYLYIAMQDPFDTASLLETAQNEGILRWPDPLRFAKAIVARVAMAYRALDAVDRSLIRA